MVMKVDTLADTLAGKYHNGWEKVRSRLSGLEPVIARGQSLLETIERKQLDPLLDWTLTLWGDRRREQQQSLSSTATVSELTADERQIHRSLYVSVLSFGLASAGALFFPPLRLLSLPGIIYASWHTYQRAYESLVEKRTVDITVFTAFVNSAYIVGGYWVLGAMGNTSYFFSLKLLGSIKDRFARDLESALMQRPLLVWTLVDGQEVQQPLDELAVGAVVIVRAGELIPVDGVVATGAANVDQHVLTGEARPVEKSMGDPVLAATIVLTGALHIVLERSGQETTVGKLSQILAQTVDFRSERQLFVQRLTDRLILPFVGLAAVTWPWLGFSAAAAVIDAHPHRQLNILGGLSLLNFLVYAAEQGILIKDGGSLEMLGQVDTLVFDKTGTLTQEQPQIIAIHLTGGPARMRHQGILYGEDEVLAYAAAAEAHQSHPIARAIVAAAAARRLTIPTTSAMTDDASYHAGFGVRVNVGGRNVHVGSARFMAQAEIVIPPEIAYLQETSQRQGHSLTMVALDGQLAGVLELQTVLRPEVKTVLAELRQSRRIRSLIVISGDQPAPTRRLAQEIGADDYYAEVLPAGKAELVAQLQKAGRKVCFVGDGINDAVALKQAHVSISLRGATTAATDTAHIVLLEESLVQLLPLFAMAQAFDSTNRQTMLSIVGAGAIGLVGIYTLGFDLRHLTILDQISLTIGTGIAMRPRLAAWQQSENKLPKVE
ncbi:MAG: heavy metal translocating P-type ATPase [Caldilineaceae bacterium]